MGTQILICVGKLLPLVLKTPETENEAKLNHNLSSKSHQSEDLTSCLLFTLLLLLHANYQEIYA